jgi:hypothetical protein
MKKQIIIPFILLSLQINAQELSFEFDSSQYKYAGLEHFAKDFIANLDDTSTYRDFIIPLQGMVYTLVQVSEINKQPVDTLIVKEINQLYENKYPEAVSDVYSYYEQFGDNKIKKHKIRDFHFRVDSVANNQVPSLYHGDVIINFTYKKKSYHITITGIGKIKGRWFLVEPYFQLKEGAFQVIETDSLHDSY